MLAIRAHAAFLIKLYGYLLIVAIGMLVIFDTMPFLLDRVDYAEVSGEITRTIVEGMFETSNGPPSLEYVSTGSRVAVLGVLSFYFVGTVLLMLPVTWVYMYTHPDKYGRSLIAALIILPICATATVWLIQDSLPLAFGLAALVSAVRFRISLSKPLDGIYIFAAISVGLSSGVSHIGVGLLMVIFFCTCATVMYIQKYGKRPDEEPAPAAIAGTPNMELAQVPAQARSAAIPNEGLPQESRAH